MTTFLRKTNNAKTTLDGAIAAGDTAITVSDASDFPSSGDFLVTIWGKTVYNDPGDDSSMEIVKVTGVSGNTLTVTRAQDDTTASTHADTDAVEILITKKHFTEIEDAITVVEGAYLKKDGSVDLTGNWTISNNSITLTNGTLSAAAITDGTATLAGGNLTSMGNITGTDVDLSLGTGDITTTGTLGCGIATLGDASTLATSAAPTADAEIANKKYVDDLIGAINLADGTTAGQMAFWDGSTWTYTETSELFWDDTNKRVGIGIIPNNTFQVAGLINFDDTLLNVALGTDALGSITDGDKNTAIGLSALYSATSGDGNIAMGTNSLKYVTTGASNVAIGYNAGVGLTTGGGNIFMGYKAGTSADDDQDNTIGIGYYALGSTSGDVAGNLVIGYQAGRFLTKTTASEGSVNIYLGYLAGTGASGTNKSNYNVGIGYLSLQNVTTGYENVGIGAQTLLNNSSGSQNVAMGVDAMASNTGGVYNVAIGVDALKSNTDGAYNFAMGFAALRDAVGSHNIGIGAQTLYKNTGGSNVAIGSNVFHSLTSGVGNVGIGYTACGEDTTGSYNTWVGYGTGYIQKGSNSNVAIGYRSCRGTADTGFSNNVAIGNYSGFTLSTGSGNIFLGNYAGYTQTSNNYRLIVDSIQRADVATEQTNAILYGVMASTPASQTLRINASVQSTQGRIVNTTRVTTTYTVLTTDHSVFCDTDGGAFTATLPAGVDGQEFFITNCGSAGLALTLDGNGAETINGELTQILYDGESVHIIFETTEGWRVF